MTTITIIIIMITITTIIMTTIIQLMSISILQLAIMITTTIITMIIITMTILLIANSQQPIAITTITATMQSHSPSNNKTKSTLKWWKPFQNLYIKS